jgi:hypothetical protein
MAASLVNAKAIIADKAVIASEAKQSSFRSKARSWIARRVRSWQ